MSDRATMKEQREAARVRLERLTALIDAALDDAEPGTALHKELSVRRGQRQAKALFKRARELYQITDPEPWITAPTKERTEQAGHPAQKIVIYQDDKPHDVAHKWEWLVRTLWRLQLTKPEPVAAGVRLKEAFDRLGKIPLTMAYSGDWRASDPGNRLPIAPDQEGAWHEFEFVMVRLLKAERADAWCLVLQQPFAGEAEAPSAVAYVQRLWDVRTPSNARWLAWGLLMRTLDRVEMAYRHYDLDMQKRDEGARQAMLAEYKKHVDTVPRTRLKLIEPSKEAVA